MQINDESKKIIRENWVPQVADRNKPQIIQKIIASEHCSMATFESGTRLGLALGMANTPDEALELIV